MNTPFELNLEKYRLEELEEIFDLPANYDHIFIQFKANKLIDNISNDKSVGDAMRKDTIQFIERAREKLMKQLGNLQNLKKIADADIYNLEYDLKSSDTLEVPPNHSIIEPKSTPYTQSLPSEYYEGVINPLKRRILNTSLNIDTRFRDNYYASSATNFNFDLPNRFTKIVSLQLSAFEFTKAVFAVSSQLGTNFFWVSAVSPPNVDMGEPDVLSQLQIVLPNGNYTPTELVAALNAYVTSTAAFQSDAILKNLVFTLNGCGGSGTMTATLPSSTEHYLGLDFQSDFRGNSDTNTPLALKLGWLMGFRYGIYDTGLTYTGEGVVDLSGPAYFFLVIDDYNNNVNNSFYSAFNTSVLNRNILARISFSALPLTQVSQNNLIVVTEPRQYFGPVDIQKIHVQLLDAYGRVMDLNHMDYSFCLSMKYVYDL